MTKTEVLLDRICRENGVRHLLTAPYSPKTRGKVERLHKTMRAECFSVARASTIEELQAASDRWVHHYNTERPSHGHRRRRPCPARRPDPAGNLRSQWWSATPPAAGR